MTLFTKFFIFYQYNQLFRENASWLISLKNQIFHYTRSIPFQSVMSVTSERCHLRGLHQGSYFNFAAVMAADAKF